MRWLLAVRIQPVVGRFADVVHDLNKDLLGEPGDDHLEHPVLCKNPSQVKYGFCLNIPQCKILFHENSVG